MKAILRLCATCFLAFSVVNASSQTRGVPSPNADAAPWVYWYWINGIASPAGIRADLAAMKTAGIRGAYLMPVRVDAYRALLPTGDLNQRRETWWHMLGIAFRVADSLGLRLGMAVSDGWATAGGPWITPEMSMQKLVWSELRVQGGRRFSDTLPHPEATNGYYRDIAVYAIPLPKGFGITSVSRPPVVTTSMGADWTGLAAAQPTGNFVSAKPCWIQYRFNEPFVCRSIRISVPGTTFQAFRLMIDTSWDGRTFHHAIRLEPPRMGWADYLAGGATFAVPALKSRYFRFVFDPAGTEPGSEDLDAAKWKPTLKLSGITLSEEAQINEPEAKNGSIWRVAQETSRQEAPDSLCVPAEKILRLTRYLSAEGKLTWQVPPGDWLILRMGHTATGATNATGALYSGLEADKCNPDAVRLQFLKWFDAVRRHVDTAVVRRTLNRFHVDSWECGSQNWSPMLRQAFIQDHGYDPLIYLPAATGIPVTSAEASERFLHDLRATLAKLVTRNFFGTLDSLAHARGCTMSAESSAPAMATDGMLQNRYVDIPMGEYWLRSPTHDKPTDILDAVSGAHIYGKRFIQAEAFTELRERWDEYPGMLKTLLDRNYAMGINRVVYHVFTENPWTDQKPGMTLTGIGLYFQRDQTWWSEADAWVGYATRCQHLLSRGVPVNDLAVFTGSEFPRRSLTPDRLLPVLPGIFGPKRVAWEKERLANRGESLREEPPGVKAEANLFDPAKWIDPLHGYGYDCINEDALTRLATVRDHRIVLPGGASYGLLVIPGSGKMQPDGRMMPAGLARKLLELVKQGARILVMEPGDHDPGWGDHARHDVAVREAFRALTGGPFTTIPAGSNRIRIQRVGEGLVIRGPYMAGSFRAIGLSRDLIATDSGKTSFASGIAWTHRCVADSDLYFISNQTDRVRSLTISLRVTGKIPELYDPVTDFTHPAGAWRTEGSHTRIALHMPPRGSVFIILAKATDSSAGGRENGRASVLRTLKVTGGWQVRFDTTLGGPRQPVFFPTLSDWSKENLAGIRYYSGTAVYQKTIHWAGPLRHEGAEAWLRLGRVANIARVRVNGMDCGVAWTDPYQVNITGALRAGTNTLEISVANTWANRLIGDKRLPPSQRITRTTAPDNLKNAALLPAGLLGPVSIDITR